MNYHPVHETYECLGCKFRGMSDDKRFDCEIHKHSKATLRSEIQIEQFQKDLRNSSRDIYVTKQILIINIFLFLCTAWASESINNINVIVLHELGGSVGAYIFSGQYWRVISSMFLHGGLIHLVMNMIALWAVGGLVERLLGNFSYFIIYFLSGLIGSLFSLYSHSPETVSVGASGAIAGVFGALVMFALQKKIPGFIAANILKNAVFIIGVNIAIGLSLPQIDNSAHLGGFLAGGILTVFIGQDIHNLNKFKRNAVAFVTAVFILSGITFCWRAIGDINAMNVNDKSELEKAITHFNEVEQKIDSSINKLVTLYKNDKITKEAAIQRIKAYSFKICETEGKTLLKFINESGSEEAIAYTELYLTYYRKSFDLIRKYFETEDLSYLQKANYINSVKFKMRPEDFK